MKPSEIKELLKVVFQKGIKRPVHIEGSPGLGKTHLVRQVARELGIGFKCIHAPLMQPEDYGFPVISPERDSVSFVVSRDKFPIEKSDCPETGILFIDEIPQSDASGQKILANLLQEREIHGQKLKDGWIIVSAGNRSTDRAGANRLLSHLKNKITTVEIEVSLDDWTNWALENGVKTEVVSFIRFRPELLNTFDSKNDINATPRSWSEGVSEFLGSVEKHLEYPAFKGSVGEGAASEFLGFLKVCRNLPSPDAILLDPKGSKVPTEKEGGGATLYALCGALSHRASPSNFSRLIEYTCRMPAEFNLLFVRDATKLCPDILTTKECIQWFSTHGVKILT